MGNSCRLANLVQRRGGQATNSPVIRLEPENSPAEIGRRLESLDLSRNVLVFVSPSCVHFFLNGLSNFHLSRLRELRLGAIGKGTAQCLQESGLTVELVAAVPNSEGLASSMIQYDSTASFIVCRADRGSRALAEHLSAANISFVEWVVYRSVDTTEPDATIALGLRNGDFNWVLLTSSMIAKNFCRLYRPELVKNLKLAAMSPAITEALNEFGVRPHAEAEESHFEALLSAIENTIPKP